MSEHKKSLKTNRSGITAVEFAVVVPVILILFFGAIEITRLNFLRHTASNAAYEAARACIVPGGVQADGVNEAMRLLNATGAYHDANVDVDLSTAAVKVTITIPVSKNSWGLGIFTKDLNIVQRFQLQREIPQG